jgi:hypothetical protein
MLMKTVKLGLLAVLVVALVRAFPDLKRYVEMARM